ncbi:thioredoxin family protein [Microbulbifer flavimaris]|uniref:Thioredoxin family protein n=1 Tax=Microbulbifer flavimaris TaxID=1781068 RepID=A0ABX4I1B8_9GAMM|nr:MULTISPECIES: thioredoxin family protein [Microbulbifer]KUJ83550.1 alkyl hydroperoxide reductase [Microbulbifer sp. ZGT114]PCO05710.1 thioredoxin family protein [Microbulbifer flavimaris]
MALTPSNMTPLGTSMPSFSLPDASGTPLSSKDLPRGPVLVAFICNHCPFVKHLAAEFSEFAREYQEAGLTVIAINSNDYANYPDDSPDKMQEEIAARGYVFPYLVDESQEVARAFGAACTPDFFLFDAERRLVYRGQFDDSRPGNDEPINGKDLRAATDLVLAGKKPVENQKPSVGCNIKWK